MSISVIHGNIFTSKCQVLVNTVNCVGVMGAGLALEFRLRYPDMHEKYKILCDTGKIDIGFLWLYKSPDRWVLNFPTKKHWRYPSKISYLDLGLSKFADSYKHRNISSIAFPLLGSDKGGIPPEQSLDVMQSHLDQLDIHIEIYQHDRSAPDDLYGQTKIWISSQSPEILAKQSGISLSYVHKILAAMQNPAFTQLNQLARADGIGIKTLEKLFWTSVRMQRGQAGGDNPTVQFGLF